MLFFSILSFFFPFFLFDERRNDSSWGFHLYILTVSQCPRLFLLHPLSVALLFSCIGHCLPLLSEGLPPSVLKNSLNRHPSWNQSCSVHVLLLHPCWTRRYFPCCLCIPCPAPFTPTYPTHTI
ncbi:hypothetical protein BDZ94DRAFT_563717 [Collybia nuda]|uniref:Uncharacterized protein n=1 Tax=Collybia nuda TaxID=64659 RepID=A0A9P6CJQ3_9AGAR|nr:hypothetical protein BDZ94DRAFT_563717 [Collybia nuda]